MDVDPTAGPGKQIDDHIDANSAKLRELDEEVARLRRLYNNLKAEIIDMRNQLPAQRTKP